MWRQGESIEFWGDIVHFACNFPPEITVAYDVDAMLLRHNVKQFAERKHPILVAGAHLPFPALDTFGQQIRLCLGASGLPLA